MQYSVAHLRYSFAQDWQQELFEQAMCDLGFEVFDEANAYIQTALLEEQRDAIMQLITQTDGVEFIAWEDCPDENWNAQWEAEHQPIQLPMDVRITPHCAFGAGHNETTSMMIQSLIEYQSNGYFTSPRSVLDMGCGTGVLAIMASKCGATHVVAVDIDDKSVSNTLENAADNAVELDVRLASTPPEGHYDLIMANIHRNILIAQMPAYAAYLKADGELWLSGFYKEDIAYLTHAAKQEGLSHIEIRNTNEWQWLRLKK
jgi:ribosomal protein L11 methyltransferase